MMSLQVNNQRLYNVAVDAVASVNADEMFQQLGNLADVVTEIMCSLSPESRSKVLTNEVDDLKNLISLRIVQLI